MHAKCEDVAQSMFAAETFCLKDALWDPVEGGHLALIRIPQRLFHVCAENRFPNTMDKGLSGCHKFRWMLPRWNVFFER